MPSSARTKKRRPPALTPPRRRRPPSGPCAALSLHDALPISEGDSAARVKHQLLALQLHLRRIADHDESAVAALVDQHEVTAAQLDLRVPARGHGDRKSTRLNSSHLVISYAVFCQNKETSPASAHAAAPAAPAERPVRCPVPTRRSTDLRRRFCRSSKAPAPGASTASQANRRPR